MKRDYTAAAESSTERPSASSCLDKVRKARGVHVKLLEVESRPALSQSDTDTLNATVRVANGAATSGANTPTPPRQYHELDIVLCGAMFISHSM